MKIFLTSLLGLIVASVLVFIAVLILFYLGVLFAKILKIETDESFIAFISLGLCMIGVLGFIGILLVGAYILGSEILILLNLK